MRTTCSRRKRGGFRAHGKSRYGALAERIGVPGEKIRTAVRYYAEYPEDVDRFTAAVAEEAEQLERTLDRARHLLG